MGNFKDVPTPNKVTFVFQLTSTLASNEFYHHASMPSAFSSSDKEIQHDSNNSNRNVQALDNLKYCRKMTIKQKQRG